MLSANPSPPACSYGRVQGSGVDIDDGAYAIGALFLVKPDESIADEDLTESQVAQSMTSHGPPAQVLDQLIELREVTGDFRTLVSVAHDWDDAERWKRSMRLLAEEFMPRFTQHCDEQATQAAE